MKIITFFDNLFYSSFSSNWNDELFREIILSKNSNFVVKKIDFIEGRPEYLRFNVITYILGLIYERVVNLGNFFSQYRIVIITVLRKPK